MADEAEGPDGYAEKPGRMRPLDQDLIDAQALELRNKRYTTRQIAKIMGCAPSTAHDRVKRALRSILVEATETARQLERDRLDELWQRAEEIATREHYVTAHGKVVLDSEGNPVIDDGPVLAARREQRLLAESYRKLEGLDQPTKVEQTGNVEYKVVGVDPADLT
ncbi:hypothetical protein [Streptomyces sp. VNUA74]|uniref:hypothetical protein n=1 Tax=Streptomyces sp. VNUA74 TaxID=3062685 RepID=UPI00280BFA7E|nr:hypothetical protein [Streptomyces sp. VNUA74]WML79170.1 hypothetical protein Q3101_04655 [Streptomyces sp. VNUA74]